MYAIVISGGKQHRVQNGDLSKVEKREGEVGGKITLAEVLLVGGEGETKIGQPMVDGAKVEAEIVRHGRDRKVLVFKKKRRKNSRRLHGHRQPFTHLKITGIEVS